MYPRNLSLILLLAVNRTAYEPPNVANLIP